MSQTNSGMRAARMAIMLVVIDENHGTDGTNGTDGMRASTLCFKFSVERNGHENGAGTWHQR